MPALTYLSTRHAMLRGRLRLLRRAQRLAILGVAVALVVLVAAVAALTLVLRSSGPPPEIDFGQPVAGQRIYDRTGLLSDANIRTLNQRAAEIERSGVPVVVFLQPAPAGTRDTRRDARTLMRTWHVESSPGAGDGIVLFFNVDTRSPRAPGVALVPGEQLKQRQLPRFETDRIVKGSLVGIADQPISASALTGTILSNLTATQRRLRLGLPAEPARSAFREAASGFARLPMAVLSGVGVLVALLSVLAIWRGRPQPLATAVRPADANTLSPVLVQAMDGNHIGATVVLVAVRRLAGQGAITTSVDPIRDTWPSDGTLTLTARDRAGDAIDRAAWDRLAAVAGPGQVVDVHGLAMMTHRPERFAAVVAAELERRGWWDATASRRHVPLVLLSQVLLTAAAMALVITLVGKDAWGVLSIGLLVGAAALAWLVAHAYPRATPLGLALASKLRGE